MTLTFFNPTNTNLLGILYSIVKFFEFMENKLKKSKISNANMNSLKRVKIMVFKLLQNKENYRFYDKTFIFPNAGHFLLRSPSPSTYIEDENEIFFLSNIMKGLSRYLYLEFE